MPSPHVITSGQLARSAVVGVIADLASGLAFADAGRVGLRTKADTLTHFGGLEAQALA